MYTLSNPTLSVKNIAYPLEMKKVRFKCNKALFAIYVDFIFSQLFSCEERRREMATYSRNIYITQITLYTN